MANALTWSCDLNNDVAAYSTTAILTKELLFLVKTMLLGVPGTSVSGSSDSVSAGMDASDRWVTSANVVRSSAGVHSWIVISWSGFSVPFYLCIDVNGAAEATSYTIACSKAAFTGGTTSARPTATDEWVYASGASQTLHDNTASLNRVQMVYSSRGDLWMWSHKTGMATPSATPGQFFLAVTEIAPPDGLADTYPVVTNAIGSSASALRYDCLFGAHSSASGWMGRTAYGVLLASSNGLCGATMTPAGVGPLQKWSTTGGGASKSFARLPLQIHVYDAGTGNWHSDLKGDVLDVKIGPWGQTPGLGDGQSPPLMRLVGNLWLPGMGASAPTY